MHRACEYEKLREREEEFDLNSVIGTSAMKISRRSEELEQVPI
jgi:hypothetical protein